MLLPSLSQIKTSLCMYNGSWGRCKITEDYNLKNNRFYDPKEGQGKKSLSKPDTESLRKNQ
jgi:hypothetical protein